MDILRTPDERFADLDGYQFPPNYADVDADPDDPGAGSLRVHYLDVPGDAEVARANGTTDEVVLCLHGEPSWSYLYRTMIPVFTAAGLRVVAPDLVGFGRSDKPASRHDYTYARHVAWLRQLLFERLDLEHITLVCQDWGGLLGLRLAGDHPERFARIVAANTMLPDGSRPLGAGFEAWRTLSQEIEDFSVSAIVDMGTTSTLAPGVLAAYDAPFPDDRFKEGARQFPMLVPDGPDAPGAAENRRAWKGLATFAGPVLTAFSDRDPVTKGGDAVLQSGIAGASGQPHTTIAGGGHFLQEDCGPELADVVVSFVRSTLSA